MSLYVGYTPPKDYVNPYKTGQGNAGPDWKSLSTDVIINKLGAGPERDYLMRSYSDSLDAELDGLADKQRNNTATEQDLRRYETLLVQTGAVYGSLEDDTDPHAAEYRGWMSARHDRINQDYGNLFDTLGIVPQDPTTPPPPQQH